MDHHYGCQISNRYTGYLDSSDHGNSYDGHNINANKRKTKKKRKPKLQQYRKFVNKAVNTDEFIESDDSNESDVQQNMTSDVIETNVDTKETKILEQNCTIELNANTMNASTQIDTSLDSGKCTGSTVDEPIAMDADSSKMMKWSDICFEEEKKLQSDKNFDESSNVQAAEQTIQSSTSSLSTSKYPAVERKIYSTVYFYNSNYSGFRHHQKLTSSKSKKTITSSDAEQNHSFGDDELNAAERIDTKKFKRRRGFQHKRTWDKKNDSNQPKQ